MSAREAKSDVEFLWGRCRDQERLLVAYRTGGQPPGAVLDRLAAGRDRWEAMRDVRTVETYE